MVAHATGGWGGPPPPTQREADLRVQLDECTALLHAEQKKVHTLLAMAAVLAAAYEKLAKETK